jgi:uncharacterized protein
VPEQTRLVDDGLFSTTGAAITLRGAQCAECGTTTFPVQTSCPRCGATAMAEVQLPSRGRLWSFTVQSFEPKEPYCGPAVFEPFGVGYVDLGPVVVESRLTRNDPAELAIDQPVELSLIPVFTDADGTTVLSFAFGPVEPAQASS